MQINVCGGGEAQENAASNIKNKLIEGIINKVKDVKEAIQGGGSKTWAQMGLQAPSKGINDEGVVILKQLPNQMIAVVLTSGILLLVSGETERIIAKYDLLSNLDVREEKPQGKILKAKLDFKKRPYSYGQADPTFFFDLVVAFSTHSTTHFVNQVTWHMTELCLSFPLSQRTRPLYDDISKNRRDLSDEVTPNVAMNRTIQFSN